MASNRLAGNQVQLHRVRLGLSPEQYGIRIGVSGMTVRRIEDGCTPFLSTKKKFASALGLEVDELFPDSVKSRKRVTA
jgi:DNA-binding XRE family transcriptional regulator